MRRLKFAAMFISCLMLVSGWLAPMSKAALEALAPDDSGAAPYSGTGLAPATPPNMESSGGKTAFSPSETSPAGELKTDVYAAARGMINKIITIGTGSACGARPSGGGARTDGREVMLC